MNYLGIIRRRKKKNKYLEGKVLNHCVLNGSPAQRKGGGVYTERIGNKKIII